VFNGVWTTLTTILQMKLWTHTARKAILDEYYAGVLSMRVILIRGLSVQHLAAGPSLANEATSLDFELYWKFAAHLSAKSLTRTATRTCFRSRHPVPVVRDPYER
jgi:hypothetical protein